MYRTVLAAVLALAASVVALEFPDTPGAISSGPRVASQPDRDQVRPETHGTPTTAYAMLEQMSPTERSNACISIEFESSDAELLALGREVERLWNGGRCDEALAQLANLEACVGPVAVGNLWRTPVPTLQPDLWETDVRIGNRDTLMELAFDQQLSSGNLFVVLRHGTKSAWYLNMSTDGGANWSETYVWGGYGVVPSVDAAVLANNVYVVYSDSADNATQVRLRRFDCASGSIDSFSNSEEWVTACTLAAGDSVRELSLVSNQHGYNNRLYITTLVSDGSVLFSWDDTSAVSWLKVPTGITAGADFGLDATENQGFDSTFLFFSYYDTNDTLRIYGKTGGSLTRRYSLYVGGFSAYKTSISAYKDTVICAFNDGTSSPYQVLYRINYSGSPSWGFGTLSEPDTTAESPGVTARGGGGLAVVFRHYTPTRELRFRQRVNYGPGPWTDPISIADADPYWNRPGIEYLGSGVFGVAYLRRTSPVVRGAFFDRSDWPTGLAEQRRIIVSENILSVTPNPLSGRGRLNYTLDRPADLRVQVCDRAGRVVRTLYAGGRPAGRQSFGFDATGLVPGVYFIRADADGMARTVPVTVVR
ncbi:hypothetical protein FJY68_11945 [candidate division WOR-3 bacterium]|uniref:T9SS type A sorting domain-containing protein n=1 Tax=candidate division WOR-3 bacterium TaxID=2052148 RepID=A0A937XFM5_UNCW3|nr:hypothetical protein [candidate division WOR-3 bacterium]